MEAARKSPAYREYGEGNKAVYRATYAPTELDQALELLEYVKGWRRRAVYVDGEKVPWDSVFSFGWCYERHRSSFKPEFHCFGYDETHCLNPWGCTQANLEFRDRANWCTWGRWATKKGDWEFDKERIRHELQRNLYKHRFCPALDLQLVEETLQAFPDSVNPKKDKDWKFVSSWEEEVPGFVVVVKEYGYEERKTMIGVAPSGPGALQEIVRKVRGLRLPAP